LDVKTNYTNLCQVAVSLRWVISVKKGSVNTGVVSPGAQECEEMIELLSAALETLVHHVIRVVPVNSNISK